MQSLRTKIIPSKKETKKNKNNILVILTNQKLKNFFCKKTQKDQSSVLTIIDINFKFPNSNKLKWIRQ